MSDLQSRVMTVETPKLPEFTNTQQELRMQIRMHILEESRAEFSEMPQDWI